MKILFVIESLGSGGSEQSLVEMLPAIAGAGFEPSIVCFQHAGEVDREAELHGTEVRVLDGSGWRSRIRQLRGILRRERPRLVHTALFRSDVVGRLAAWGVPTVLLTSLVNTSYAPIRLRDPNLRPWKLEAARLVDSWTARHLTDHFHAVSRAVEAATIEALGIAAERITVIERGRDPARLGRPGAERRRRARRALGLADETEVLVNVGRQEFGKGQRDLVCAMVEIARSRPGSLLLVAGRQGAATAELEHLRRELDLGDRIRFLGYRRDVPDILAAADLFVFPSLYEGLPGAVVEAMALGLPVVASDIPPVREVVEEGENALLVPPADAGRLAAAAASLLADRDRAAAFGRRSREIFERRFTLERSTRRMVALYRRLLLGEGGER